ncbi:unnamed protein product [Candida verbasci]|uniref:Sulfatase N-terminal domain-containing protein n=1 Tax=Candida verbasci TaxID=1227364 RepID=A0A9W4TYT2_9ASCO|nr:unnamed protein product [Candida verbasci]
MVTKIENKDKPNFLLIISDDLGFTDISPFGGEIYTPNLDKLAKSQGIRFTDFHTASACSPTRSMLLSGTDNHIAGLGQMAEFAVKHDRFKNKPGYEGYLNDKVAPLPEILKDNGYFTWLSGKWHLGLKSEYWPVNRGFEKSWTLLPGAGNHYKRIIRDPITKKQIPFLPALYAENDLELNPEEDLPEDFYSTTTFANKAIEFIDETPKDKPFFGLLTFTAPHWPYQAPQDRIAKYKGVYDGGPEELRRRRLQKAKELGIFNDEIIPHPIKTTRKTWDELTKEEKEIESKIVATYAAMVEIIDEEVGRILKHLEDKGELDNTFILFTSDNGAEGQLMEALPLTNEKFNVNIKQHFNNALENIGNKDSFVYYGDQWAQAATAPHAMYKMWSTEGAIVCPLILRYPPLTDTRKGEILNQFTTVMDILPTVLELANVEHPGEKYKGRKVAIPRGKSWVKYLKGDLSFVHDENTVTGWELFGQQAIRKGNYKAVYIPKPFGPEKWQLFNIIEDPGETKDLSELEPKILESLCDDWAIYASETGLIELGSDLFEVEKITGDEEVFYRTLEDK